MKKTLCIILIVAGYTASAQQEKAPLWEGNNLYRKKDYQKSLEAYNKALTIAPANPLANYNMGNTQFRLNKFDEAEKMYDNTISNTTKKPEREKAWYNKGVSLTKQQKLEESIAAYKEALKLDAKDEEARENLQKALLEKKKQDQKNQPQKQDEKKDKKDEKQNKKEEQKDKPQEKKEKQSKLSRQQIEQLLKSLQQKEKEVQKKLQKKEESGSGQPAKDW